MGFRALHCRFPQATKVWSTFGNEFPGDALSRTELGDDSLCFLRFEEFHKPLQFTGSADKVCSMVTPNERGFAATSNEVSESSDEGVCGLI
jgi:hypothetical protein